MAYLTPILLARKEVQRKLRDTWSQTTVTKTSDGAGGFTTSDPVTVTGKCSFSSVGGNREESPQVQQRGDYRLRVMSDAAINPALPLTLFGRQFMIVWTPPVKALSMTKIVGLMEVGSGS